MMRGQTTLGFVIPCAISAIAGTSLQAVLGRGPSAENQPPPAYYDFEAAEQRRGFVIPSDRQGGLRLLVRPSRYGAPGLRVDIEVWNLSDDTQLVDPIDPARCPIWFRDPDGKDVLPYRVPSYTAYPVELTRSEMVQLRPANRLAVSYLLPCFYTKVKGMKKLKVQADFYVYYHEDKQPERTHGFKLSSGWVGVPP
jgi:hypothetical protein